MSTPILTVENISKRYRNGRGAHDISFTLEKGDVFGLLGANGAGKTTVMKMLTGLCRPTSGSISMMGYDADEYPEKARYRVASLIEAPAFYPYLSAKKNLALAAHYYPDERIDNKKIEAALEQVNLLPYKDEKASGFSLGMKQRLGLALTIISNPSLYILDEPSNGLDIEGRVDIRNIIIRLARKGNTTFIISSHLSEEIQKMCNLVGIMKDGTLVSMERMDVILSSFPTLESYYLKQIGKTEEKLT